MGEIGRAPSVRAATIYLGAYYQLKSRYFRVLISLFIASVPQAVLYSSYLEPWATKRLRPVWILFGLAPYLVYFAITFIRVPPPMMPRGFQRIIRFVTYWYATSLAVLAVLALIRPGTANWHASYEEAVLWGIALVGCVAIPTLLRCCRKLDEAVKRRRCSGLNSDA